MAPRKLNVLVYTGTGTTLTSVRQCIYSLRRLLSPNYAVIPVTETALLKEPWAPTCALLVIPGGADLGYCRVLNGDGNRAIAAFVRRGGAYLGFCAGGYYGSRRCEFEVGNRSMEVVGARELAFYPGTCRGGAFRGFAYHSEEGARAPRLKVRREAFSSAGAVPDELSCYYNGGGVFIDAAATEGVEILASYADDIDVDGGEEKAAVIYCKVGEGAALLTGPHPEFAAVNLEPHPDVTGYDDLMKVLETDDVERINFLKACLTKLGLEVNQDSSSVPALSKMHLSALDHQDVGGLLHSMSDIITKDDKGEELIKAENDTFHLEHPDTRWSVTHLKEAISSAEPTVIKSEVANDAKSPSKPTIEPGLIDYSKIVKSIISHDEALPQAKETPYFNHNLYYSSLQEYRQQDPEAEVWGDVLMYGEVVTSTNTLLEKNPKLLAKLPTGFTLSATTQVAARGRGNNVWIAPPGALILSTVINHPAHQAATRPIVFIQYLAAVAIVEAIHGYGRGYEGLPVKLKWPNDIYARDPSKPPGEPPSYVKVGGILANCAYSAGSYQIVLGIGINTNNGRPTTSLDALLPAHNPSLPPFRIERLLARILTRLETLYSQFIRRGFTRELEEKYYEHWLHSDQMVTLEGEGGVRAKVVGITRDWGLLKAEEVGFDGRPTGRVWALQSNENSFDFWRGLVKRKV